MSRNMRQTADQHFMKLRNQFIVPDDPAMRSHWNPLERESSGEEKEFSTIMHEEKTIGENLTATYWG